MSPSERSLRKARYGDLIARCVTASAEHHGVGWDEVLAGKRGRPVVARARVVAMHACIHLKVPLLTTAKAFRRYRRAVRSAVETGRPGRERRDAAVMEAVSRVVARVEDGRAILP